jgi:hypothetical protein
VKLGVALSGLFVLADEEAFRDNNIHETVLPNLTAEDLKELGVSAPGHRRKLLDAISALRSDGVKPPTVGAATMPTHSLLHAGNNLGRAQEIFATAIKRRRAVCGTSQ